MAIRACSASWNEFQEGTDSLAVKRKPAPEGAYRADFSDCPVIHTPKTKGLCRLQGATRAGGKENPCQLRPG
jgi:hypothetical protein